MMTRTHKPHPRKLHRSDVLRNLHALIPAAATLLQVYGLLTREQASAWGALILTLIELWISWRAERKPRTTNGLPKTTPE